ncbi:MAG: cation:proton antiporter [Jatrophihabitans sp.]
MDLTAAMPMIDLAIIISLALVLGRLSAMVGQPPVIGEIVAGVLMGPTLFHGGMSRTLFPNAVRPFLTSASNLGLIVFVFLIGMELAVGVPRGYKKPVAAISLGATLLPFGLGALLAFALAPTYATGGTTSFVLFMGVALSVTAFPVLARIVSDRGMGGTRAGQLALSAAAICDLVAWTALALVQASVGNAGTHWQILLIVPFAVLLFAVGKPLLRRLLWHGSTTDRAGLTPARFAVLMVGLLGSAAITQLIGLHLVFGAFLFGMIMPRDLGPAFSIDMESRLQLGTLLLPVYFVEAGFNVDLSHIGWDGLLVLPAIVAVAVIGKFGGTLIGARAVGLDWHSSSVVATLMNTRGLTELIVLTIGLQMGVLSRPLYSIMVLMALVTTTMSGPLLQVLTRPRHSQEPADGGRGRTRLARSR